MTLHKDKFEYMCHKHCKHLVLDELPFVSELFQYWVSQDISLRPVHQLRDLGILISSDLSWSPHIKAISDKARKKAAWVLSVFHTRSPEIMLTLYKSMVRSLLEYCSPLWNPSKISDIQELESVQKAFTARIAGVQSTHYWDRLKELSLMSLQRRRERYNDTSSCTCERSCMAKPRTTSIYSLCLVLDSATLLKFHLLKDQAPQQICLYMISHLPSWVQNCGIQCLTI